MTAPASPTEITIRPMRETDLGEADRIYRMAFGTRFGLKDPMQFRGDSALIADRWKAYPEACFVAEADDRMVGAVVGMDWGSVFVLGPLMVLPDCADRGIAKRLLTAQRQWVKSRRFAFEALYTNPASPKHIHLYESLGYRARQLTAVMAKTIAPGAAFTADLYSALAPGEQKATLESCRRVSDTLFPGLDLSRDIEIIAERKLGDTVLLQRDGVVRGFALCHMGPGSEAGSGALFVKFAASLPGDVADFTWLIESCESLAAKNGLERLIAGVNMAREEAYWAMKGRGYRTEALGVAMLCPDQHGYNRKGVFALDDWR